MMQLKGCPKCRGDLYLAEDIDGEYVQCLQCGYLRDLSPAEAADFRSGRITVEAAPKQLAKVA